MPRFAWKGPSPTIVRAGSPLPHRCLACDSVDTNIRFEADVLSETWIALHEHGVPAKGVEILFVALHGSWPETYLQIRLRDTRFEPKGTWTNRWHLYKDGAPIAPAEAVAENAADVMWSHQVGDSMRPYDEWPKRSEGS